MTKKKIKVEAVKLEELSVEYVPVDSLQPNEYNPNRQSEHEFELLKRSIHEDGFTQPVLCLPDGRIIDGEHRWKACKELGWDKIPVVKVDMSDAQRRVATLRHNLARGSHDVILEGSVLRDLESLGVLEWAQEALQLDDVEVQRLLEDSTPLDVWGATTDEFGDSWEYSPLTPGLTSEAALRTAEDTQKLKQAGMAAEDAQLVKTHMTMTSEQQRNLSRALGDKPVDTMNALAQAHMEAKDRASRGEWTTLTFIVPTAALEVIDAELNRLKALAPAQRELTPELERGLALEKMAVLSGQTPAESLS